MPYRTDGRALDAPVSILLVTSRETKRWVMPKGNVGASVAPHAAAAQEAEEEAGVRGAVCPTPLGTYRYRKRKGSGASLMADVEVFPLAVTEELAEWKEKDQRERRWFSLAEAADAVDEPDLRDLIRSFGASEFNKAARRDRRARRGRRKIESGSDVCLVPAPAAQDRRLLRTVRSACGRASSPPPTPPGGCSRAGPSRHEHIREIHEREHDADEIIREVLKTVRQTFLTPFDRSAITALIGSMDDAIDEMQAAASAIDLYEVKQFAPGNEATWRRSSSMPRGWSPKPCRCCATSAATAAACTS